MGDDGDRGIKYYGIPSGYEFVTILEAIKMVSSGQSGLSKQTKDFLKGLKQPINLKVFVTPTCPYCPRAVNLAFQMAYESPMVTAEAYEAIEFPHFSNKYGVQGVPRTVINDTIPIEGAAPENMVVDAIKKAIAG
jgi:glutaredoxin-like protein